MWTVWIALLLWAAPTQGVSTTCEIPAVEKLQNTSLTCKFSEDISKQKQDFEVQFYKNNATDSSETILRCYWMDNKLECRVHSCCEYDGHVTANLKVRVLSVTDARVGRYVCFVLPAVPDGNNFCNFTLIEKITQTSGDNLALLAVLIVIPVIICIVIVWTLKCRNKPENKTSKWKTCHSWTGKKGNDDSKKNSSQHSGNISVHEEELLLPQPVGEAQKQTDSCEPTVKHNLEQGAEEGANTTEDISDTDNIKTHDIDGHSKLTQKRLEGNDAQTATQESDISEQSAVPLQKPGDDTADSKPHAAKRIPPLVTTSSGGKPHPLMLPDKTKQRKHGGQFWKSAGAVNNPQKALIKQYNRTAEDEEANRSKKKRSSKARKTLEQSKGGKSFNTRESVPPIINVESSQQAHMGAFSESLSLPQSSSSTNDNCTDICKTTIINQDEHANADSSTEPRNILQDNDPTHGTNVSSCEIDLGTCTSTNDSEDSSGLTVQSGSRQPCTSSETAKEFTVTVSKFEQEVYGEETKPKPKNRILNVIRPGSKGGKNKTKGKKPKDMATPQEP